MSNNMKVLVVGPQGSGKSTIANILGEIQDGPSANYRPTVGVRIIEYEKNAPASAGFFGKINIEMWDVSGDMRYEKCWGPVQKDANGIIFVLDPAAPDGENQLVQFQRQFMQASGLSPQQSFLFVNHHRSSGSIAQTSIPRSFENIDKAVGSAEDSAFVYSGFERFYTRCLREMKEQQTSEENRMMD